VTRVALLLAVLLTCRGVCASTDLELWRAFDVQIEILPESTHVNGLPLLIHRATGSGVSSLVETLKRQWIQEVGIQSVRTDSRGDWVILSRIHAGSLQLLQWRGSGKSSELIWSSSNLRAHIQSPTHSVLALPPGCVAGRTVHGDIDDRGYLQRTAHCTSSPHWTLSAIGANASRQGYAVQTNTEMLVAHRRGIEVVVVVSRADPGAQQGTSLVYLQVVPVKESL